MFEIMRYKATHEECRQALEANAVTQQDIVAACQDARWYPSMETDGPNLVRQLIERLYFEESQGPALTALAVKVATYNRSLSGAVNDAPTPAHAVPPTPATPATTGSARATQFEPVPTTPSAPAVGMRHRATTPGANPCPAGPSALDVPPATATPCRTQGQLPAAPPAATAASASASLGTDLPDTESAAPSAETRTKADRLAAQFPEQVSVLAHLHDDRIVCRVPLLRIDFSIKEHVTDELVEELKASDERVGPISLPVLYFEAQHRTFEVVAGRHRVMAARLADEGWITALVVTEDDPVRRELMGLEENIVRRHDPARRDRDLLRRDQLLKELGLRTRGRPRSRYSSNDFNSDKRQPMSGAERTALSRARSRARLAETGREGPAAGREGTGSPGDAAPSDSEGAIGGTAQDAMGQCDERADDHAHLPPRPDEATLQPRPGSLKKLSARVSARLMKLLHPVHDPVGRDLELVLKRLGDENSPLRQAVIRSLSDCLTRMLAVDAALTRGLTGDQILRYRWPHTDATVCVDLNEFLKDQGLLEGGEPIPELGSLGKGKAGSEYSLAGPVLTSLVQVLDAARVRIQAARPTVASTENVMTQIATAAAALQALDRELAAFTARVNGIRHGGSDSTT